MWIKIPICHDVHLKPIIFRLGIVKKPRKKQKDASSIKIFLTSFTQNKRNRLENRLIKYYFQKNNLNAHSNGS